LEIEFDQQKSDRNEEERGIPFSLATEFEWNSVVERPSNRYGEERFMAFGLIRNRVHALVYTKRGLIVRVISLRRANEREVKYYEEARSLHDR
jgi:uncharacterized DUF497 family protein